MVAPIRHQPNPTPAQRGSGDSDSPQRSNPEPGRESQPLEKPMERNNSEIKEAQHHPKCGLNKSGLGFSLEVCEERRFVQESGYSSMPNSSRLSILRRRNYWDLYQSCRGEIFLLSPTLGQAEGHCRHFTFPTRAGEVQRESRRFMRWAQMGPGRVLGKRPFLRDHMPASN